MAKTLTRRRQPEFIRKLVAALSSSLADAGIDAEVEAEPVRGTKLHRIMIVAAGFKHLRLNERQDLVWRIASTVLTSQERLRISMILTLTPQELDIEAD